MLGDSRLETVTAPVSLLVQNVSELFPWFFVLCFGLVSILLISVPVYITSSNFIYLFRFFETGFLCVDLAVPKLTL